MFSLHFSADLPNNLSREKQAQLSVPWILIAGLDLSADELEVWLHFDVDKDPLLSIFVFTKFFSKKKARSLNS